MLTELMIDAEGRLMSASIKKNGGDGFDEAAFEAARKAIFRPTTHDRRPTARIILLPIHFTLRDTSRASSYRLPVLLPKAARSRGLFSCVSYPPSP